MKFQDMKKQVKSSCFPYILHEKQKNMSKIKRVHLKNKLMLEIGTKKLKKLLDQVKLKKCSNIIRKKNC